MVSRIFWANASIVQVLPMPGLPSSSRLALAMYERTISWLTSFRRIAMVILLSR